MAAPSQANRSLLPENWGLLYAAFAFSQGIGLISYWTLPLLAGALLAGLGLSTTEVGLLGTIEFIGLLGASLLLAPFVDRGFRRAAALVSVVIIVAANLASAFAPPEFWTLAGLRFVAGLGAGLALAIGNATIANARDPERFSSHLTLALVAFMVVVMPIVARLSGAYGYQGVFLALAGIVMIGAVSLIFLPNGPNADLPDEAADAGAGLGANTLLTAVGLVVLTVALLFGARDTLPWLVAEQLGSDAGMSVSEVGDLFSLMYAVSIAGPVSMLLLTRIFGPKTLLFLAMTATGLFAWMFTVSDGDAQQFSVGIIAWATIYFIAFAQLNAVAALFDRSGRLVSAVGSSFIAGVVIAPVVGGYLIDLGGYGVIGAAELALTALIAAIIIFGLPGGASKSAGTTATLKANHAGR
ncbi:MAG: MFS transporter [Pseudomonadota bacterium]